MIDINHISAYAAFILAMPICFAYLRIACSASPIVRHMAISLFCVVSSFAWRTAFWDVLIVHVGEAWRPILVEGLTINALWNVTFIYGCVRGLMALHLMVPEEDRQSWPVWKAWLYPPWRRLRLTRR